MAVRPLLVVVVFAAAACGDDGASSSPDPSTTESAPLDGGDTTATDTTVPTTSSIAATARGTTPAELAAALCAEATGGSEHDVASDELVEISGIAATTPDGGVWAHNDSGDTSRVFAVGVDGSDRGVWELAGVDARDWEDMAAGPGPDPELTYLYLADIGDNDAERREIVVHRVVEPEWGSSGTIAEVESFTMTYEDGPHNAESFMVDPQTADWYVITKGLGDGMAQVFHTPAPDLPGDPLVLQQVATVDLTGVGVLATAADVSPDGGLVAIRTYSNVLMFHREAGAALESAFDAEPCLPPVEPEEQGEAVAFLGTTGYVTISEGDNPPVNVFAIPG